MACSHIPEQFIAKVRQGQKMLNDGGSVIKLRKGPWSKTVGDRPSTDPLVTLCARPNLLNSANFAA